MEIGELKNKLKEYGRPIYIYNQKKIIDQFKVLKASLFENAKIYYSMKANPNKKICEILLEQGSGIEVASAGEYELAVYAGANPNSIIFTSPGKTKKELEIVISRGIGIINAETIEEIEMINEIALTNKRVIDVALRINPAVKVSNAKIKMTGVSSQFGIEETEITEEFIKKILDFQSVNLIGIQVYMGTNMLEVDDIVKNTEYIINLSQEIESKFGFSFSYINFGGGFGVPYFKNEKKLNMSYLKQEMSKINAQYLKYLSGKRIIFESGRFLLAESGQYIVEILHIKESKGKKYIICNGGSNFHASSAFLGRFVRNNYPMSILGKENDEFEKITVVGPLCTPTDVLGKDVLLSKNVKIGDYVVISMSGAYGLTYSPALFLLHEMPTELLNVNGKYIDVSMLQRGYINNMKGTNGSEIEKKRYLI